MNRLKKVSPLFGMLFAAVMVLMTTGCDKKDTTASVVTDCADAPADKCDAYKDTKGATCELDSTTNKCRAKATSSSFVQSDCQKIGADKDKCQKDDTCVYKNDKCENADENETGKCLAIKVDTICNAHTSTKDKKPCVWNAGTSKCEDKPAVLFSYYEMTFAPALPAALVAGSKLISAIGTNGNKSRIYIGASDKDNALASLDTTNLATASVAISLDAKGVAAPPPPAAPGKRDLAVGPGAAASAAQLTRIIPGPGARAIVSLTGVNTTLGGILLIDDNTPIGAWYSNKADLGADVSNNKEIASIGRIGDYWLAFQRHANAQGAYFNATSAAGAQATSGLKTLAGDLGRIVTAVATKGNALYLASTGLVNEFVPGGVPPADIDFGAGVKAAAANLEINAGTANNDISALGVVGDFLLVGMSGAATADKGGVALIHLTDPTKNQPPAANQSLWDVNSIDVSSDGLSALITTSKGWIFFSDGKLVRIDAAAVPTLTVAAASQASPIAFTNDPAVAAPTLSATHLVGAVHINDTWYVATDNEGVFPVRMETKQKAIP